MNGSQLKFSLFTFSVNQSNHKVYCLEIEGDHMFAISGRAAKITEKMLSSLDLSSEELDYVKSFPFVDSVNRTTELSIEYLINNHPDFEKINQESNVEVAYANDLKFLKPYPYRMT